MLTRIIVSSYAILVEIALWVVLVGSFIGTLSATGSVIGAIVSTAVAFALLAVTVGGFLMIDDIRKSVKRLEEQKQQNQGQDS